MSITGFEVLLGALSAASAFMLVGSVAFVAVFLARIPPDYFAGPDAPPARYARAHPGIVAAFSVLRNLLGFALILAGVAMLVLPGQGLLTILVGLIVAEFPGKRRLELAFVRRPGVHSALNWLRGRLGREPFAPIYDP